jgi:hypothetical protein
MLGAALCSMCVRTELPDYALEKLATGYGRHAD